MVKKNYKLIDGENIAAHLKPGRHFCNCQARIHGLVRNCLGCGRIVCEQEGSGPCFYCGKLVCTRAEREIIDKRDTKGLELLRKLYDRADLKNFDILTSSTGESGRFSLSSIAESFQGANLFKQKLLIADKDQEITKVNDLQADYFALEHNPYLTANEREAIIKRKEELRQLSLQEKRNILVDVDVSNIALAEQRKLVQRESVNDPVLQSILTNSMARQTLDPSTSKDRDEEATELIDTFRPKYREEASRGTAKLEEVFNSLSDQFAGLSYKRSNGGLFCIGLLQPLATDLATSVICAIPWGEYLEHRGPVLIAALDPNYSTNHFKANYTGKPDQDPATTKDYPTGTVLGMAQLDECMTWEEYCQEDPSVAKKFQLGGAAGSSFVLLFNNQELLLASMPYVCASEFFEMDKEMAQTIRANLISDDFLLNVPIVME